MKKVLSVLYLILCIGTYILLPFLFLTYNIKTHSEDSLLFLTLGIATTFNYFITVYIRGFLFHKVNPKYSDNDFIVKIFNVILIVISSMLIYQIFSRNSFEVELIAKILIVYVIASFVVLKIECKNVRKTDLYSNVSYFIKKKEKILKYILIPLISSLICVIPCITLLFIKTTDIKEVSKIFFGILLGVHLLIIIISYIYSKINYHISYKKNNEEEIIYKPSELYYEMFLYIFPFVHFLLIVLLIGYYERIINFQLLHSCYFLFFAFIVVIITNKIQKKCMFNGIFKRYSVEDILKSRISNNNSDVTDTKTKNNFKYSKGYITNEFGTVVGKTETISNGDVETTIIEDEFGNTKAKNTKYKL